MKLANILFFLMMFAPAGLQFIKIPIVIISVIFLLLKYMREIEKNLNVTVIIWFLVLLMYGIIWNFIGALKDNPGVSDTFRLNVIWVVLYALYVFYIDSVEKFKSLLKTMIWATIAISIYNIAIVLSVFDIIPNVNLFLQIDDELTNAIGVHSGFIQLTSNNIGSLTFLAPFVLSLYIMKSTLVFRFSKIVLISSVTLSIITVIISGRRALWLEMLIAPLLIGFFNYSQNKSNTIRTRNRFIKFYSFAILLLIAVGYFLTYYINWELSLFIDRFIAAFTSDGVRYEQAVALLNGFIESPLIGSGFGVGVPDVVRSDVRPWTYELTYVLMLYNTGILGSTLYIVCIAIIYRSFFKYLKNDSNDNAITYSLFIGLTCYIISNSTNPYFGSYDFMWPLYLPIAYINVVQSKKFLGYLSTRARRAQTQF